MTTLILIINVVEKQSVGTDIRVIHKIGLNLQQVCYPELARFNKFLTLPIRTCIGGAEDLPWGDQKTRSGGTSCALWRSCELALG